MGKINIQKDELVKLYLKKKLSTIEIAKRYNCSYTTICKKLHQEGIKLRRKFKKINATKHLLKKLYINKQMPSTAISKEVGCSPSTIIARLREYKIPIRSIKEIRSLSEIKIGQSELTRLYLNDTPRPKGRGILLSEG